MDMIMFFILLGAVGALLVYISDEGPRWPY
jgi:hypothetical protein